MRTSEMRWTVEQARAIVAQGHTLLEANAGTGKTTTVIGKILWRIGLFVGFDEDLNEIPINLDPCALERIAAITFTEKAAYDLKRKLREAIRSSDRWDDLCWEIERASIGTIHGFCADLLREHALRLRIDPSFKVMDEMEAQLQQDDIIKDVVIESLRGADPGAAVLVAERGLQKRTYRDGVVDLVRAAIRELRWHPERYRAGPGSQALDLAELRGRVSDWDALDEADAERLAALYRLARNALAGWLRYQEEENVLDFDALILKARDSLLADGAGPALASLRRRYRLLVIDELQDTDGAQRDIAFAIAGLSGGNDRRPDRNGRRESARPGGPQLFLVGDPKQSIYRFRGADVSVWGEVKRAICGEDEPLKLTRNFRSDPKLVEFVNRVSQDAIGETGAALAAVGARGRVDYAPLVPHRASTPAAAVEWLEVPAESPTRKKKDGTPKLMNADERRDEEARRMAARIRQLVDADGPEAIRYAYRDIAVLFATRTGVERYEAALREYGVRYFLAGDAGLTERLEILDLVNVLRVLEDPADDLRAFAYLRSPFVGLRDEVLARIKLDPAVKGGTLLRRAADYAEKGEWFPAIEHKEIAAIEREALRRGVRLIEGLSRLRSRWPLDRLLEEILDLTGYRAHLCLTNQPEPKLANVQRFVRLLQGYRTHTLGSFLEVWSRWQAQDLGIPQAPLYSRRDNVVTLSTIHSAKGLEWPVVFLVDTQDGGTPSWPTGSFWNDPDLGPILCPTKSRAGARAQVLAARETAEEQAEQARLIYVAATRARDRLVITGPLSGVLRGHARWLAAAREVAQVSGAVPHAQTLARFERATLDWLGRIRSVGARPAMARPLSPPRERVAHSATELMTRRRSRREWRLKYRHGVIPAWFFAGRPAGPIPAWLRGAIIHGVLERIEDATEVAQLLDATIGALDAPELEERLAPGTQYRSELEVEIERVVSSGEWAWYTAGEHWRELPFVQLLGRAKRHVGAFDLFRPGVPESLIVDFKTHDVDREAMRRTAEGYRLQALLYNRAAAALFGPTRVRLHFTRPNAAVDFPAG